MLLLCYCLRRSFETNRSFNFVKFWQVDKIFKFLTFLDPALPDYKKEYIADVICPHIWRNNIFLMLHSKFAARRLLYDVFREQSHCCKWETLSRPEFPLSELVVLFWSCALFLKIYIRTNWQTCSCEAGRLDLLG